MSIEKYKPEGFDNYDSRYRDGFVAGARAAQRSESKETAPDALEIIKAVAHVGIDWGYGVYELEQKHIDKAREIYEAHEGL